MPLAFMLCLLSPATLLLKWLQKIRHGRAIAATEINPEIVFILGHWRSGTTLLHELLALDDRFAYSNTFECCAPHHFIVSQWFFEKFGGFLLPKKRPMDNMSAGWLRPQEDEFALLALGAPTPYRRMAFPNRSSVDAEFLNMEGLSEKRLSQWKDVFQGFLRTLSYRYPGKRLILKSPPHTGRIGLLREMFPTARFVHITRDPLTIFASTCRLWKSLDDAQALQVPRNKHLKELVFDSFERMYDGFERHRHTVDESHICDIRYADLVADPLQVIAEIYDKLNLGDFAQARPKLAAYVAEQRDYKTNVHQVEPETAAEVRRRWSGYFEKYGYADATES